MPARATPIRVLAPPMATPRLTEVLQWHRLRESDPGTAWIRDQLLDGGQRLPVLA